MLKTLLSTFSTAMGSSQSSLSLQSAVDVVIQWRSRPRELIFDSGRHAVVQYLHALDKLRDANAGGANDKLVATAVERLKSEFDGVLRRHSEHPSGPSSTTEWSSYTDSTANAFRFEDYTLADAMSGDVIECLKTIADRMSSIGKIDDCARAYKTVRKPYLQSQLKRLRFDELRGKHNQKRYVADELRVKMELWIQVSKICVKILFEKERNLCHRIFSDADVADECFVGTVKDPAVHLFQFADDLSTRRLPYSKMGSVFAVYDAFLWVLPSAEALFVSRAGKGIREVCALASSHIEIDVTRMLYELGHDVLHEILGSDVFGDRGEIHPTTQVVMEQIDVIVKNKNLLTSLIKSPPLLNFGAIVFPQEEYILYTNSNSSLLEQHLVLIILVLLKNLDMKFKRYQDPSLGHLFIMNNVRCILMAIEGSNDLQEMIGARLLDKMISQLESARSSYQTTTCNQFLTCLRDNGIYVNRCCFGSRPSKATIRRRLNDFNVVFEKVKVVHSSWKIPDSKLRDEIRRHMSEILVSKYTEFLEKFGNNPETREIVEGSKRHSAKDLEVLVQCELFANSE